MCPCAPLAHYLGGPETIEGAIAMRLISPRGRVVMSVWESHVHAHWARYEPKSGLNLLATTELAFFFSSNEVALVLLLTFL